MTKPEVTEKEEACRKALAILQQHFDAVQILCSFQDSGNTNRLYSGVGNWYARQGMASEFIKDNEAQEVAVQIAHRLNPEDPS